jgi:hypothetical protein
MFPFQPIDLSKLSYTTVFDLLAPMLPGGTIALGWLYGHQSLWANLQDEKTLKIMVAVFAVYVVGFVMIYLTSFEMSAVALAILIRKMQTDEPWRNPEWRKLASAFLGELSPPVEEPPADSSQIQVTNAETLSKSIKENFEKRMAPLNFQRQWQRWYEILKVRFQMPAGPQQAFANLYFSTLNSLGWAGPTAAYISFAHVCWLSWAACILTIVISHVSFTLSFNQQQHPDPSGDQLAAEILRTVEAKLCEENCE